MIDCESVKRALESNFYTFKSSGEVTEISPHAHFFESEEDLRCSLFMFGDRELQGIIAGILINLLTDLDKSGIKEVVRALVPQTSKTDRHYNEEECHRFDNYDESEAKTILFWLAYIRPLQWGAEDNDIDAAEAFWNAKVESFQTAHAGRTAKCERAKRKRANNR